VDPYADNRGLLAGRLFRKHNGYQQSHRCPADRRRPAPGPTSLRAFPATGKRAVD
jgi:hypothetical protein